MPATIRDRRPLVERAGEQTRGARMARPPFPLWLSVASVGAVIGTLLVYEPWRSLPFEIVDFSEFLPLLHAPTFAARWHAFLRYYESQGRWNVLSYLGLITKWSIFGTHTAGWQLTRFVQMWLIIVSGYFALRRLGADQWGSAAGAGLFAVATPAVPAWLRLTMGEPLGFICLLPALLLATRYRRTPHWRSEAMAIAALVALALLAKEMLVAFVPFLLVVACCVDGPGRLAWPRATRRTAWLVAVTGLATLVVLAVVARVARMAGAGSFASAYGPRELDVEQLADNFASVMLPARQPTASPGGLFATPANALFLIVLALGVVVLWRRSARRTGVWWQTTAWVALAVSLPAAVVAAYERWSFFQDFYGLPYLLAPALLLAGAVTVIDQRSPGLSRAVRALCAAILVCAGIQAYLPARQSITRREIHGAVAAYLARHDAHRPILVMTSEIMGIRWQGAGPTFGRYVAAMYPEAGFRPFQDQHCAVPPRPYVADGRPGTVVTYARDCGTYPGITATFRMVYRYPTLVPFGVRRDSLRIDVCDPTCTR